MEWMDASTSAKRPQEASSPHGLTDRQLQVAGLIAEGERTRRSPRA
ncbi:hypothetical protein [Leucobacter soli]